ncbi:MAG: Hpt domain-containing protein, partial [Planctomycetota bacterium]|nr:Hpt domain-containing protein [Planctomycetota bacterium]
HLVCTRNLSSGGAAFLHGGFVHIGSEAHLTLMKRSGGFMTVIGTVVSCRLVRGRVHEVGVSFYEKIDLDDVIDSAEQRAVSDFVVSTEAPHLNGEVLCAAGAAPDRLLLEHHLRAAEVEPVMCEDAGKAIDRLKRQRFDVVIIDLDDPEIAGSLEAIMRETRGAAVALLSADPAALESREDDEGVRSTLTKPWAPPELLSMVEKMLGDQPGSALGRVIHSELEEEGAMAELIRRYLEHVNESIEKINAGVEANDLEKVRTACQSLKGTASGYGFPLLSDCARKAVQALDASGSIPESIRHLHSLETLARRLKAREQQD